MKQVTLENIQPGMIAAKDVHDRNGRLILKAGSPLQENHLRIFKLWRITSVYVEGESAEAEDAEPAIDPVLQKKLDIKYKQLFKNTDSADPFTKQLYHYAYQRAVKNRRSGGVA